MRKMKSSGVEWIGEIPEDWDIKRLKAVLCERNESNNPIKTDYILSLTNDRGVIPYDEKGDVGNKSKEDLSGYKLAYLNDIVLNSMNVIIGSVALSKYYGCVSPVYYMLYPRNPMDDVRYYNYIFQTKEFQSKLKGYGNGIMEIRMRIQMSKLNTVELPTPDATTQTRIADYLDEKCGKVDRYIEKQQQIIDKLKEYKQAVITEAVIKGLNPDVPMKDGGVTFVCEVPSHWSVIRFKYITDAIGDGLHGTPEYDSDGEYYFLNGNNIGNENLVFKDNTDRISEFEYKKYKPVNISENTILITLNGATYGKTSFYHNEKILLGKSAGYITLKNGENKCFVRFYLQSNIARLIMELSLCGSTIANLSLKTLNEFVMPYPPLYEQEQIVEYLTAKCSEIDRAIDKKESLIEKITEYKKSLIYEAVTGKLEV